MTKEYLEIDEAIKDFSMAATYIPQRIPLREGEKHPYIEDPNRVQFKWRVRLHYKGREILETPYSCGIGCFREVYTPPARWFNRDLDRFELMLRDGYAYNKGAPFAKGDLLEIKLRDVVWCLLMDGRAIDNASFEDWADEWGYDKDSRKAEKIYCDCIETGLRMRAAVGEGKLQELYLAYQDY